MQIGVKILKFLIFVTLYLSALISFGYTFKILFGGLVSFLSFALVFLIISLGSKYIRKRNPDRFLQRSFKSSIIYFFISSALSFFLVSLVFNSARNEWLRFVNGNPAYRGILDAAVYRILIFIPPFALLYPIWRLYSRKKGLVANTIVAFLYVFLWIFVLYLFARNIFGLEDLLNKLMQGFDFYYELVAAGLFVPLLKFIVGSLPFGWFYELFIGTVAPKSFAKG